MSLVNTPIAEQLRIVITGLRNVGKSSLFNSIIENNIAIVSNTPGTTTDPVIKSMEMGNLGPVVFVDTAGIDDIGELGQKRIDKTYNQIEIADIIIFVTKINEDIIEIEK
ncbi:MAG: Era-like GTP-binding protein, partial [Candidatus Goldbacteria bacterium]|nr:Era-like GTP-binding protein [Candidatus Goldiibacteriota bacterium]